MPEQAKRRPNIPINRMKRASKNIRNPLIALTPSVMRISLPYIPGKPELISHINTLCKALSRKKFI
jgi:hypothetical protein